MRVGLLLCAWLTAAAPACGAPDPETDAPAETTAPDVPSEAPEAAPLDPAPAATTDDPAPPVEPAGAPTPPTRRRALWVLCEGSQRVLDDPARIDALLARARSLDATDLFVQVYRGGRAWYDASLTDAGPYRAIVERTGEDTLRRLLERAHAEGLRVHAWVNVFSLAGNRDAHVLEVLGSDAVMVDHRGRSVLDYPDLDLPQPDREFVRMGTPAVWLDPGAPGVAEHLASVFGELVERYPALDGLHLDYFRYPDVLPFSPGARFGVGVQMGYGEATRARFREETGLVAPFGDSLANASRWDDWRRDQVTRALQRIRRATRAGGADLEISAAVWAWPVRGYLSVFQDWRGWLAADLLEMAVPMLYSVDDHLLRQQVRAFGGEPDAARIWIGLGTWLFADRPARALAQLAWVREAPVGGEALFSYDAIEDSPPLAAALADGVAPAP